MVQNLLQSPSLLLSLAIALAASQALAPHKSMAAITVAAYFLITAIFNLFNLINPIDGNIYLASMVVSYLAFMMLIASTHNPTAIDKLTACVYLFLVVETCILMLDFQIYPDAITWIYRHDPLIQVMADIILLTIGALGAYLPNYRFLHRGNSDRG